MEILLIICVALALIWVLVVDHSSSYERQMKDFNNAITGLTGLVFLIPIGLIIFFWMVGHVTYNLITTGKMWR